ncbi:MAG: MFS transporter [Ardenticatenaceae bacterium]|nr:MFS transporter [Ardenticatenaceae bacterium]
MPNQARARRHSLKFLVVGTLLSSLALYIYLPTLIPYALSRGASLTLVGVISGSYGFIQVFVRIPLGVLSDHWQRRKWFVVFGAICGVVSCLALALADDVSAIVVWRAVAGIGGATHAITATLFALQFDGAQTQRAMGIFSFSNTLAFAVGPLLGGLVGAAYGWRAPFLIGAVLGTMGLLMLIAVTEPAAGSRGRSVKRRELTDVVRRPVIVEAVVLIALLTFAQFVTTFTFIPVGLTRLGAGPDAVGILQFVTMSCFTLTSLVSGTLVVTRLGSQRTVGLGVALVGISVLAVPWMPNPLALTLAQAASGVGWGLCLPVLWAWALDGVESAAQGTGSAVVHTGGSVGILVGPIAAGLLAERLGLNPTFLLMGIVCLLAAGWPLTQATHAAEGVGPAGGA